jgi:hypothetical protein
MGEKKLSVRKARMEMDFAIVKGDRYQIGEAEKELAQALAQAERRRLSSKTDKDKKATPFTQGRRSR